MQTFAAELIVHKEWANKASYH